MSRMVLVVKPGSPLYRFALLIFFAVTPFEALAEDLVPLSKIPVPPPERRYPVKNDQASIKDAYSNSTQWEGRAVSVEGTVKSIETNARDQPSIELVLGASGAPTIWATWPTHGTGSFLRVGERVRMLGWVRDTVEWSKVTHLDLPRQNPMTLLPICLVKVHNSDSVFDGKYAEYCQAWEKGFMPENLVR